MKSNPIRKLVKEIQFKTDKTLDEIAADLDYSGAYFRNEVSKGTSLTVLKALQTKFNILIEQNVSPETSEDKPSGEILPLGSLRVTLKDHFDLLNEKDRLRESHETTLKEYASIMKRLVEAKLLEPNSVEVKTDPTKKRPIVDLSALNPEVPVPPPGKPEEHRGAKRGSNRGEGKKNKR